MCSYLGHCARASENGGFWRWQAVERRCDALVEIFVLRCNEDIHEILKILHTRLDLNSIELILQCLHLCMHGRVCDNLGHAKQRG